MMYYQISGTAEEKENMFFSKISWKSILILLFITTVLRYKFQWSQTGENLIEEANQLYAKK